MNQVSINEQKIVGAFTRLAVRKDNAVQKAMAAVMESAVNYAIEIHENDPTHWFHTAHDSHYGWVLLHDKQIVDQSLFRTGNPYPAGRVDQAIKELANSTVEMGWVGYVVAGMGEYTPYRFYDWYFEENKVMPLPIKNAKAEFPIYFVRLFKQSK